MVQTLARTSRPQIIPAVPGEYYAYSSGFTAERPIYALMKCKASKSHEIDDMEVLGNEANLFFEFGDSPRVHGVKVACLLGLLGGSINNELLDDAWVARVDISADAFYELRSRKDGVALADFCRSACSRRETSVSLKQEDVVAVVTSRGKYGLFLVKELTQDSMEVDACHILL